VSPVDRCCALYVKTDRRWSLPVGRIAGIEIRIHATFLLLFVLIGLGGAITSPRTLLIECLWVSVVFICVLVHELAHSFAARHYAIPVKDILLLPIGGVSEIEDMPREPGRELTIAAVGPLTSFAIALVALSGCILVGDRLWPPTLMTGAALARLTWLNVLLGGFNLLPALPLDGGRVLRAGLTMRMGRSRATEVAARLGRYAGVALMMLGFLYDLWLVVIGLFVYLGATIEGRDEKIHLVLSERTVADSMKCSPWKAEAHMYVSPEMLSMACRHQGALPVTRDGTYVGLLGPAQIGLIRPAESAGEAADRSVPAAHLPDRLDEVLDAMRRARQPAMAVVGPDDCVVGIVGERELQTLLSSTPPGRGVVRSRTETP
jgi:Zn-dependent protease